MDYKKIKLENERCEHVTKRLNRLGTWDFFKVLYRDSIGRLFGFNILMLICLAPLLLFYLQLQMDLSTFQATLPINGSFSIFASSLWTNVDLYYGEVSQRLTNEYGLYMALGFALSAIIFSGGFAVIRDSFWTGKLGTVGVLKSMWMGIKSGIVYGLVTALVSSFSVYGIVLVYQAIESIKWLAVVVTILLCILFAFVFAFLLIMCSVAVTYRQDVKTTVADAWRLLWLNVMPNLSHVIIALIPVALLFLFTGGLLQSLFYVLVMMFGGMYFPLVWQTHMMKTFALFHPVETKK